MGGGRPRSIVYQSSLGSLTTLPPVATPHACNRQAPDGLRRSASLETSVIPLPRPSTRSKEDITLDG